MNATFPGNSNGNSNSQQDRGGGGGNRINNGPDDHERALLDDDPTYPNLMGQQFPDGDHNRNRVNSNILPLVDNFSNDKYDSDESDGSDRG